tara:strand:- start:15136 stop:17226 length:2091 start_codon:yes stop_codon:yes gene_type:complete
MERLFFSKQNYSIVYNILKDKLYKSTQFDIGTNRIFEKELVNIMKTIYANRTDYNLPVDMKAIDTSRYLSQKVINVSNVYFKENIINFKKTQTQIVEKGIADKGLVDKNIKRDVNRISQRPIINEIKKEDVNKRYEELLNNRSYVKKPPQAIDFTNSADFASTITQDTASRAINYDTFLKERNTELTNFNDITESINEDIRKKNKGIISDNYTKPIINTSQVNPNATISDNSLNHEINTSSMIEDTITNYDSLLLDMNNFSSITDSSDTDMSNQFNVPVLHKNYTNEHKTENIKEFFPDKLYETNSGQNNKNSKEDNNEHDAMIIDTVVEQTINLDNKIDIYPKPSNTGDNMDKVLRNTLEKTLVQTVNKNEEIAKTVLELSRIMQSLPALLNDIPNKFNTLLNTKKKLEIKEYKLIINSGDREFSDTNFNKYNFSINFGGNLNDTIERGILNNGSNGQPIVHEDVVYKSANTGNPYIQRVLKNIQSIKLDKVIIPKPNDDIYLADPYYYVSIEELDSNVLPSKRFGDKIFSKVTFDKYISFGGMSHSNKIGVADDDDRKFLYYKNDTHDNQIYNPPKAVINKLTIKLLNPRGEVMSNIWLDSDLGTINSIDGNSLYSIDDAFANNAFRNDQIQVMNTNKFLKVSDLDFATKRIKLSDIETSAVYVEGNSKKIINLSNQIQYFFTVTTTNRLDVIG